MHTELICVIQLQKVYFKGTALFYTEWIRYYVEPPRGMKTLISARGGNRELADCPMLEDLSSRDECVEDCLL